MREISSPTSSSSRNSLGLRRQQASQLRRYCFTWNNYPTNWRDLIEECSNKYKFLWAGAQEIAPTTNTPHSQGYLEFKDGRHRYTELHKEGFTAHFEKARGSRLQNLEYIEKDLPTHEEREYVGSLSRPIIYARPREQWYVWQRELYDKLQEKADSRTIHWYWESVGRAGKSEFIRNYCINSKNSLLVGGKAQDCLYGATEWLKKHNSIDVLFVDIPRSVESKYISYQSLEMLKNACWFAGKYESQMVITSHFHIVVFANYPPDTEQMSKDRWSITNISISR
jgi:hypothetical protein